MVKSEDQALYSLGVGSAVLFSLKRNGVVLGRYRFRLMFGTLAFICWQRFLASGKTTKLISPSFYTPRPDPMDDDRLKHMYYGDGCMFGKVCIVTGASLGGVGFNTAVQLFRLGATVIVTTRSANEDTDNSQNVGAHIIKASHHTMEKAGVFDTLNRLHVVKLDLDGDIPDAIDQFMEQIDAIGIKKVDVLVNNAGAMYSLGAENHAPRHHPMGIEQHCAVNAVAPILLTEALKPRLADDARVVHVSCDAHRNVRTDSDLDSLLRGRASSRNVFEYFGASKLVNICYAAQQNEELEAERLAARNKNNSKSSNVVHVAVHPGVCITNLYRDLPSWKFFQNWGMSKWIEGLTTLLLKSPLEASHSVVYCCADPYLPGEVRRSIIATKKTDGGAGEQAAAAGGGGDDNSDGGVGQFYYVDCGPGNKYLSSLAADKKTRDACLGTVKDVLESALNRKRKMELRMQ